MKTDVIILLSITDITSLVTVCSFIRSSCSLQQHYWFLWGFLHESYKKDSISLVLFIRKICHLTVAFLPWTESYKKSDIPNYSFLSPNTHTHTQNMRRRFLIPSSCNSLCFYITIPTKTFIIQHSLLLVFKYTRNLKINQLTKLFYTQKENT